MSTPASDLCPASSLRSQHSRMAAARCQSLYVSERTAENHVQHILTKLGLRNRSQIAVWASGEPGTDRE